MRLDLILLITFVVGMILAKFKMRAIAGSLIASSLAVVLVIHYFGGEAMKEVQGKLTLLTTSPVIMIMVWAALGGTLLMMLVQGRSDDD